jgi:hypothetical protein
MTMMGPGSIPANPQAAMSRRPRPEDAASHITVRVVDLAVRLAF